MTKKGTTHSILVTFLNAFVLALTIVVGQDVKDYMAEKQARDYGSLQEIVLRDTDFEMNSMRRRQPENGWKATDGDPQLVFRGEMVFTGVQFYMEYNMYPGEMLLYYVIPSQADFSNSYMTVITPVKDKEGWFEAQIPVTQVSAIRIDPTVMAGNHMVYGDFIINPEKSLADYIEPDGYSILSTVMYTLAIFAVLRFVKEFFTKKSQ